MLPSDAKELRVCARHLGDRIRVRELERAHEVAPRPLTRSVGARGRAFVFRFGAVVLVDTEPEEERAFVASLATHLEGPHAAPESEEVAVRIDPEGLEGMDPSGVVQLAEPSVERLSVLAEVLAKSTVLAHYEERAAAAFDRAESLAEQLERGARTPGTGSDLLQQIGEALLTQTRTVGRVEVTEKPEITWDAPELDRLYERLAVEYELRDRDRALTRKLELVSRTSETTLDLLQTRRGLRLELYIVILIVVEIVLILYDIFWH